MYRDLDKLTKKVIGCELCRRSAGCGIVTGRDGTRDRQGHLRWRKIQKMSGCSAVWGSRSSATVHLDRHDLDHISQIRDKIGVQFGRKITRAGRQLGLRLISFIIN
jgi:hypothetical protein